MDRAGEWLWISGVGLWASLCTFFVEAGFEFFGVPLVVESEEAVEDGAAGGFAEGVAFALLGGVEAVAQVQIAPAVGGGYGMIHLDV